MKSIILVLSLIVENFFLFSGQIASLPEISKPDGIYFHHSRLFVADYPQVHVYSFPSCRLLHSFGRAGEGPGEFKGKISGIHFPDDRIMVESTGKLSFYSWDGKFQEDKKTVSGNNFIPLGEYYVGTAFSLEGNILYRTFNIYDGDLKKMNEFFRVKSENRSSRLFLMYRVPFGLGVCAGKIFIAFQEDFVIPVFSETGEPLFEIKEDYHRIDVTHEHRAVAYAWMKQASRYNKIAFENWKEVTVFPGRLPALRDLSVMDDLVVARTYHYEHGDLEFYIYGGDGKLIKRTHLPFKCKYYPDWNHRKLFRIQDGCLYQLIENQNTERWELHAVSID